MWWWASFDQAIPRTCQAKGFICASEDARSRVSEAWNERPVIDGRPRHRKAEPTRLYSIVEQVGNAVEVRESSRFALFRVRFSKRENEQKTKEEMERKRVYNENKKAEIEQKSREKIKSKRV